MNPTPSPAAATPTVPSAEDRWNLETAKELLSALFILPAAMEHPNPERVERVARKIAQHAAARAQELKS